jgi:riboflavin biosynthesis pyrimidine reductase
MNLILTGPGSPYRLLFEEDTTNGSGLPEPFRMIYGGDWYLPPAPADRPYSFTNFVASHDGRISFNIKGNEGGGDISRHAIHDSWLMGLIRARADAILVGATTLRISPQHRWTPESVFKADGEAFAALRELESRPKYPILVLTTLSGDIPADARAISLEEQQVVIATTAAGAERARAQLGERVNVAYHISPTGELDLPHLFTELRTTYGAQTLLSEAGPRIYSLLLRDKLLDEAFLTISPIIVGNPAAPAEPRPGLVEGVGFSPDNPPQLRIVSLRRWGDYLFERVRFGGP